MASGPWYLEQHRSAHGGAGAGGSPWSSTPPAHGNRVLQCLREACQFLNGKLMEG